jgi:DNA-binding response OmpR family regulator
MGQQPAPRTILAVDDTPSVRTLIVQVCKANGYRVIEATSGEEALRLAGEEEGMFDVLVTDVDMPGISGLELATNIRLTRPRLRVCFISGRDLPPGALAKAERSGRTAFLMKPFDLIELVAVIRALLEDRGVREGSRERYDAETPVGISRLGLVALR